MMNKIIEEWLNGIAAFFNHLPITSHQTVYNHIFNIEVLIPPIEGKSPPQLKTRTCLPMGRDFSFQWQPPSQRGEMFLLKKLRYKYIRISFETSLLSTDFPCASKVKG